jgi:hypothetical protein
LAEEQKKTPQTDGESTEPAGGETSPGDEPAAAKTGKTQADPATDTGSGTEAASTGDAERTPEPAPPAGDTPAPEPDQTIAEPVADSDTEPVEPPAADAEQIVTEPPLASPDPRTVAKTESASMTSEPATPAAEKTVPEASADTADTAEAPADEAAPSAQTGAESSIVSDTSKPDADPGPAPPDETDEVVEAPDDEAVPESTDEPAAGAADEAEAPVAVAEAEDDTSVAFPDPLAPYGLTVPDDGPVLPAERTLEMFGGESVVLQVAYINRAEAFYHDLFEMDVVLRAWRRGHDWETVTGEFAWEPAMIHGEFPAMSYLRRDDWSLVLESAGRGMVFRSAVAHEALVPVSPETLRRLRARVLIAGYTVLRDQPDEFAFRDPFRIVWRITAVESPN